MSLASIKSIFYSAFILAVGHGTVQHGTLNFASVNGYRSEPNRYMPGSPGPATSTVLAQYGTAR